MSTLQTPAQDQHSELAPQTTTYSHDNGDGGKGSNIGKIARIVGLLVILGAAGIWGYFKLQQNSAQTSDAQTKTQQAANRAIPVTATAVVARTMPIYLTELGTVTAYSTVTIKSRVDGQLLSVNVQEGQHVKQGQLLAMIDPAPYNAAVAQAEGQLTKDQASADYAKTEAARYKSLYDAGVVSKDSQQVQESSAGQSAGVLAADRAAIQAAKVNVAYTKITSPINGVVGLRQVDAGNIVHASDATGLLVVTQLQPIAVIFTIPEDQLPTVRAKMGAGKPMVVEAYDRSETTHLATGKLLTLDNEIDTTTGTVKAKAVFANADNALFPNQFVNIRLILEQREGALVMPASALQSGANGSFVYLLKKGTPPKAAVEDDGAATGDASGAAKPPAAAKKPAAAPAGAPADAGPPKTPYYVDVQNVEVDLTEGTQIIIKSGLKAGDQVVTDGQEKLKKYSKVDPSTAAPRAGRGGGGAGAAAGSSPQGAGSGDQPQGRREGKGQGNQAVDSAESGGHKGGGQGTGQGGGQGAGSGGGHRPAGAGKPGAQQ